MKIFKSIINTVEHTPVDTITRLSALFFNLGKINTKTIDAKGSISYDGYEKESALIAEIQLKHLKASNEIIYSVKKIVKNFTLLYKNSTKKELKKIALDFGDKNLERLFDLMNANLNSKRTGRRFLPAAGIPAAHKRKQMPWPGSSRRCPRPAWSDILRR